MAQTERCMIEDQKMSGRIFDVATLAEHWACGTDTIYSLVRSGELAHFKLGGKLIRIRADEVERYECRTITHSQDTEKSLPSSGTRTDDATAIRLERLIAHPPKQQPARSGNGAR